MPVTDHYIFRDQIDSAMSIIVTAFPQSHPGSSSTDQAIAPHPKFGSGVLEMRIDPVDFIGKQYSGIPAPTTVAIVMTDIKYFIKTGMKRIGFEYFHDFIDQIKYDLMYFRMQGAITLAV